MPTVVPEVHPSAVRPGAPRPCPTSVRARGFLRAVRGAVVLALATATSAAAQEGTARAVRLPADVKIGLDGHLAEAVWATAPAISDFRTREPLEGADPSERTEVRILWDDDALYVGVMAWDAEPDRIVARIRQRDQLMTGGGYGGLGFAGDDGIALIFDPFDDDRNGVVFATNPNGAFFDALLADEGGQINVDWQGVWEVAGARTEEGWSAEFRIPWRSIRYPAGSDVAWGLNVLREIPRRQEEILWRSWQRDGGGFERVARAGALTGLVGLPRPGSNIEVKPYVLTGTRGARVETADRSSLEYDGQFDVGVDLKAEVRPGLVLDLTANTDFAQVEVDDQQVNLTRFSLFFPERRDFFLENSGVFEFGRRGYFGPPPFLMFFSRRIGIGSSGPVPILGGGRLSGRVGDQTIGLLSIATDEDGSTAREIFNVARVKRDIGESGYLGAMVTDRRGGDASNTVAGIDGRLLLHPTVEAEGFFARSFTEGAGGEGNVVAGSLNWTRDLQGGFLSYLEVGDGLVSRAGFVGRTDYRNLGLNLRQSVRPGALGVRKIDFRLNNDWGWTTSGRFQERGYGPSVGFDFDTGDSFTVSWEGGDEQVDRAFTLADSLAVPEGRFATDAWSVRGSTSGARPIRLSGSWRTGDFYGGTVTSWSASVGWAPSPAFVIEPEFSRNDVVVPSGSFVADISAVRATWAASPRMTANAYVQYNGLTERVVTNIRFNFIHRPGSDLFIVFSDEQANPLDRWRAEDRGLLVKATWLVRF